MIKRVDSSKSKTGTKFESKKRTAMAVREGGLLSLRAGEDCEVVKC